MEQSLIWRIIEESKSGKPYLSSEQQYSNLTKILSTYDEDTVYVLQKTVDRKMRIPKHSKEFHSLHWSYGGIVYAGDDGLYLDFASWVVAQGEELFNQFKMDGAKVIFDYIKEHNVPESDYTYESMCYAFSDYFNGLRNIQSS